MQLLKNKPTNKYFQLDWLEIYLLIFSSTLLGIWAVANTIALRNILLALGTFTSAVYLIQLHHQAILKQYFGPKNLIALSGIFVFFLWVLAHCFLFPSDYLMQIKELKSIWLRSLLGSILGFATGVAMLRNFSKSTWITIGMLGSFLILLIQYLLAFISSGRVLNVDWNGGTYIYLGKPNAVLVGMVLLAMLWGCFFDRLERLPYRSNRYQESLLFLLHSTIAYIFLFAFNARSGEMYVLILIIAVISLRYRFFKLARGNKNKLMTDGIAHLRVLAALTLPMFFIYQQNLFNQSWHYLFEDALIVLRDFDKLNWLNVESYQLSLGEDGRTVFANNFQRISWFIAGLDLLVENPIGTGSLKSHIGLLLTQKYPSISNNVISSHSGWIDLGLSFGYLGLLMMFISFFWIICCALKLDLEYRFFTLFVSATMVIIYLFNELSADHGIEILFYVIALLSAFITTKSQHHSSNMLTAKLR